MHSGVDASCADGFLATQVAIAAQPVDEIAEPINDHSTGMALLFKETLVPESEQSRRESRSFSQLSFPALLNDVSVLAHPDSVQLSPEACPANMATGA